jgi:hypothetical protein
VTVILPAASAEAPPVLNIIPGLRYGAHPDNDRLAIPKREIPCRSTVVAPVAGWSGE